jgi:hypothetical protein
MKHPSAQEVNKAQAVEQQITFEYLQSILSLFNFKPTHQNAAQLLHCFNHTQELQLKLVNEFVIPFFTAVDKARNIVKENPTTQYIPTRIYHGRGGQELLPLYSIFFPKSEDENGNIVAELDYEKAERASEFCYKVYDIADPDSSVFYLNQTQIHIHFNSGSTNAKSVTEFCQNILGIYKPRQEIKAEE